MSVRIHQMHVFSCNDCGRIEEIRLAVAEGQEFTLVEKPEGWGRLVLKADGSPTGKHFCRECARVKALHLTYSEIDIEIGEPVKMAA